MLVVRAVLAALVVAVSAGQGGAWAEAERLALVVGNSEYERPGWRLENPVRDADLVAQALRDVGFDVTVVKDADKAKFEDAVKTFGRDLRRAGAASTGLFYYSGHAVQSNGLNYLAPIDVQARTEADVWAEAPRLNLVLDYMNAAGNASNFVILDACRDNPLPAATRSAGGAGMARVPTTRGLLIAYSTAPGLTATDGEGRTSPFSAAFAELVRAQGLTAEQLFKRVADRVEAATDFEQTPLIENGLRGADFCFNGCGAAQRDPADLAYWNDVKDSGDEMLLRSYLEQFPNGAFTRLATARIEAIRRGEGRAPAATPTPVVEPAPDPAARPGESEADRKARIRVAQRLLNAMGYDAGPEDGEIGARTRDAAAEFRALTGTANTGFDQTFVTALNTANAEGHRNASAARPRTQPSPAPEPVVKGGGVPGGGDAAVLSLLASLEGRYVGTCNIFDIAAQTWQRPMQCGQTQTLTGPATMSVEAWSDLGRANGSYTYNGRANFGFAEAPAQGASWRFEGRITSLTGPRPDGSAEWSEESTLVYNTGLTLMTRTNSTLTPTALTVEQFTMVPGITAGFQVTERSTFQRQGGSRP